MIESLQCPWDTAPAAPASDLNVSPPKPKPRGRRPAAARAVPAAATAPDWLYHHLTISGPAEPVDAFAAAARGSGILPWHLDASEIEEQVFALAVAQPARVRHLTVEGCRILARQFRDQVEAHQARAAALVGHSQACPLDLHTLLPIPDSILQRGPTDPAAQAWLTAHWGTTDRLRQVSVRPKATAGRRLPAGHAVQGYGFFTAGDTPHAAIAHVTKKWPGLRFALIARPPD